MATDTRSTLAIFALITKRKDLSFEAFKDYYENSHIPYVNKLIGGEKYISTWTRNYFQHGEKEAGSVQGYENDHPATWDFDVITQIVPKSQAAFDEMWEKFKELGETIAKDEKNFMDRERSKVYFVGDVKHDAFE